MPDPGKHRPLYQQQAAHLTRCITASRQRSLQAVKSAAGHVLEVGTDRPEVWLDEGWAAELAAASLEAWLG